MPGFMNRGQRTIWGSQFFPLLQVFQELNTGWKACVDGTTLFLSI